MSNEPSAGGWAHPSIRALEAKDPVAWVTEQARHLAYRAIEAGWSGPPFDPAQLADMLRIEVRPSQDVLDAQLVPSQGGVRIEFNPNRSPGRIRYSIAHEIGHTLFPDHSEQARHRLAGEKGSTDAELEVLCNLAAAEILMPVGSFPELATTSPSIDSALHLRSAFDLSMEAVLLRIGRLAKVQTMVFAAAPVGHLAADGYRLDYAIRAWSGPAPLTRGYRLPARSVVGQCTAIGFTAKGLERWRGFSAAMRVEAVGIPPYPGDSLPRVAGLLLPASGQATLPSISYLVGDATQPRGDEPKIIVHVVNDATPRWGGGFALEVRKRWPSVQGAFLDWAGGRPPRLGTVHVAEAQDGIKVASMVAQHGYGPSARPRIRYQALEECLEQIAATALESGASVHAPRIGAGQAGGDWSLIAELIENSLVGRGVTVMIYDLPAAERPNVDAPRMRQLPLTLA